MIEKMLQPSAASLPDGNSSSSGGGSNSESPDEYVEWASGDKPVSSSGPGEHISTSAAVHRLRDTCSCCSCRRCCAESVLPTSHRYFYSLTHTLLIHRIASAGDDGLVSSRQLHRSSKFPISNSTPLRFVLIVN